MYNKQQGIVAMSIVIVIAAVLTTIGLTVTYLSIGEGQSGLALFKGENALTFTEGCAEDAMLQARAKASYTSGTITRPEGICSVTVSKAGSNWTITVTDNASSPPFKRTVQTVSTYSGYGLTLTTWKEI